MGLPVRWGLLPTLLTIMGAVCPMPCAAQNAFVVPTLYLNDEDSTTKGHGWVSIGYQNTYIDGFFVPVPGGKAQIGAVRVQSISLDADYFFADRWSAHLGIPFIESRYGGDSPHCIRQVPLQCRNAVVPAQPHPESKFLDDGSYHGTWQDWNIGMAYHGNVGDYLITPSATAYIPSHEYTFFAQAAPGQDLRSLEVAVDLSHQFELSNLYYRVHLGHIFAEKTLGYSIDHNRLDLELGYFLNDAWTVKAFAVGRKGNGNTGNYDQTTELWYHHDQIAPHNYANVGGGFDYRIDEKDTLSATVQRLVWGRFVFDFKYSIDVHLTRAF